MARVRVAELLELLAQPLADAWPGVEVSNYGASRSKGNIIPDVNGHPVCRYAVRSSSDLTCGAPVLGSDSYNIYGTLGQVIKVGWQNNPDRSVFPTTYPATAPNAFRLVVNRARAASLGRQAAAGSLGGLHVWVQPKEMVIGTTSTPMACAALIGDPSAHCESGTYWEEAVLHVALSGVTAFGYWGTPTAGATTFTDIRFARILAELDGVVGVADRSPHNVTTIDWMSSRVLVVSSMSLNQGETTAHRVACLDGNVSAVQQAGTVKVSCDGTVVSRLSRVFLSSVLVSLTSPVSPMGVWVLQSQSEPCDSYTAAKSDDDEVTGDRQPAWASALRSSWDDGRHPLPILPNVAGVKVYNGTRESGLYSHAPMLSYHDGLLLASWKNHNTTEDSPGQFVRWAWSNDGGQTFSKPATLFPNVSDGSQGSLSIPNCSHTQS